MDKRLPYYMTYPMLLPNDDEKSMRRDLDYMKSIYPRTAKRLLPYVGEECDRMEYSGSMMYDEYPDQLQLRMMCRRIYDQASQEEDRPGEWLMDLIQVMVYHELCQRRCEYRNCGRRFY